MVKELIDECPRYVNVVDFVPSREMNLVNLDGGRPSTSVCRASFRLIIHQQFHTRSQETLYHSVAIIKLDGEKRSLLSTGVNLTDIHAMSQVAMTIEQ